MTQYREYPSFIKKDGKKTPKNKVFFYPLTGLQFKTSVGLSKIPSAKKSVKPSDIMISDKQLNPRVRGLTPSATLQINEYSNQLIREGRDIIKLGLGQSPFPVPDIVTQSMQKYAHEKDYLPVKGLYALRCAVAEYYQRRENLNFEPDSVIVGPGSKELLYNLQMACEGELLLPAPSWVSYAPQALILGRRVRYLPTEAKNQWRITPEQLDQLEAINENQIRILILNYPSNPTGCSYEAEELQALAEAARRNHVIIVADEIYGETNYDNHHISMASYYPEGTIISSGLSKWCGAGGWRLGIMLFPKELMAIQETMAVIASETFTSTSAPTQYAACVAFSESPEMDKYLNNTRTVLKQVADYMYQNLTKSGLRMQPPVGGFYLLADFEQFRDALSERGILTSGQLCQSVLNETGVAFLPGEDFGLPADQLCVRMAFVDFDGRKALASVESGQAGEGLVGTNCPKLVTACERLDRWLKNL